MAALRVIQWTTGNIGRRSLHAIATRPDMELVGVYAHSEDKIGRDAAELGGLPEPTGIVATNDIDALISLKPDACVYNPLWSSTDELCRLLEAGINVCSTAGWITGAKLAPSDVDRVRKSALRGGATMFGSGAHPGFTNLISIISTQMCERVDRVKVTESVDCSGYASKGTMQAMGFSMSPETPGLEESVRRESEVFAEAVAMTADVLGVELDRMTFDATFAVAHGDSDLGFMRDPIGDRCCGPGLPPWLDRRPERHRGRVPMDDGLPRRPAVQARARSRHQDRRPPKRAHLGPGAAGRRLERAGIHGTRRDLHGDARRERRARCRRGTGRASSRSGICR